MTCTGVFISLLRRLWPQMSEATLFSKKSVNISNTMIITALTNKKRNILLPSVEKSVRAKHIRFNYVSVLTHGAFWRLKNDN